MIAPLLSAALFLLALAFVLLPLFGDAPPPAVGATTTDAEESSQDQAIGALREIEFDRATGKLSDEDYAALKERYTTEAVAHMRSEASPVLTESPETQAVGAPADEVEGMILHYRSREYSCRHCGPRPEIDAVFCSTCGRYLAGRCGRCRAAIDEPGARFCQRCGHSLAA
ncbi:MAG: zinc ribbon domain-containing protein [Gemmatimonadota bacterium]|nr:zinc ribbon domain-containing protein [Gemmatimonadota bacterium]